MPISNAKYERASNKAIAIRSAENVLSEIAPPVSAEKSGSKARL